MKITVLQLEDFEAIVQTSVEKSLSNFFSKKSAEKKKSKNLSIKETAEELNVTDTTVRNYIQRGFIKAEKIGGRIFIDRNDLEESLKEVKSFKYRRDV